MAKEAREHKKSSKTTEHRTGKKNGLGRPVPVAVTVFVAVIATAALVLGIISTIIAMRSIQQPGEEQNTTRRS